MTSFYIFAHLFGVRLNRRLSHSHVCFCIHSLVKSHVRKTLENSAVYTCDKIRVEKATHMFSIMMEYYGNSLYYVYSQIMSTIL